MGSSSNGSSPLPAPGPQARAFRPQKPGFGWGLMPRGKPAAGVFKTQKPQGRVEAALRGKPWKTGQKAAGRPRNFKGPQRGPLGGRESPLKVEEEGGSLLPALCGGGLPPPYRGPRGGGKNLAAARGVFDRPREKNGGGRKRAPGPETLVVRGLEGNAGSGKSGGPGGPNTSRGALFGPGAAAFFLKDPLLPPLKSSCGGAGNPERGPRGSWGTPCPPWRTERGPALLGIRPAPKKNPWGPENPDPKPEKFGPGGHRPASARD